MAIVCPLFSSSGGNATYIGYNGSGILIDAGVTAKRLSDALAAIDVDPAGLCGVFVTHEHSDHIKGLRVFCKKYHLPVYCSERTADAILSSGSLDQTGIITPFETQIEVGGFTVRRFCTSHDCEGSSGYFVTTPDGKKVAVCTDLGYVSDEIECALTGADLAIVESNHDITMLRNGPYPPSLKRRILSDKGHLSNHRCADLIAKLAAEGTSRFVLAHISRDNNTPDAAIECTQTRLTLCGLEAGRDYLLEAAAPEGNRILVI